MTNQDSSDAPTITLFRPVGERELAKIYDSDCRRFPPRLGGQPIFYPVLTKVYAEKIARDWNSTDEAHNHVGYVTRFAVRSSLLANYDIQLAGGTSFQEYWIPADDLETFNDHIVGLIEVIAVFRRGQQVTE